MTATARLPIAIAAAVLAAGLLLAAAPPATPVVHEMVAAYCSGGGHGVIGADGFLEPPGISDMSKQNFAEPVEANGVAADFPFIADRPAAKFPPGTFIFTLDVSQADHPSAQHCRALNP
jgi:hypothetical protein